ncbi:cupin, partial [Bacillus sp. SIMBA_161]
MTIDRLTINELSYDLFVSEYADKKPFILTGAMDHWECRPWTLEYIDEHYGDR